MAQKKSLHQTIKVDVFSPIKYSIFIVTALIATYSKFMFEITLTWVSGYIFLPHNKNPYFQFNYFFFSFFNTILFCSYDFMPFEFDCLFDSIYWSQCSNAYFFFSIWCFRNLCCSDVISTSLSCQSNVSFLRFCLCGVWIEYQNKFRKTAC